MHTWLWPRDARPDPSKVYGPRIHRDAD